MNQQSAMPVALKEAIRDFRHASIRDVESHMKAIERIYQQSVAAPSVALQQDANTAEAPSGEKEEAVWLAYCDQFKGPRLTADMRDALEFGMKWAESPLAADPSPVLVGDHDFPIDLVERIAKACIRMGISVSPSMEEISATLKSSLYALCRAIEHRYEQIASSQSMPAAGDQQPYGWIVVNNILPQPAAIYLRHEAHFIPDLRKQQNPRGGPAFEIKEVFLAPVHKPDCGACPGDGTICTTSCRLADDSPPIHAQFEVVSDGIIGTTDAPVKRIERNDDNSLTVVIDHWPKQ